MRLFAAVLLAPQKREDLPYDLGNVPKKQREISKYLEHVVRAYKQVFSARITC